MEKAEKPGLPLFFYNAVYTFLVAKSTVGWDTHTPFNRHCNQPHDDVNNIANILAKTKSINSKFSTRWKFSMEAFDEH